MSYLTFIKNIRKDKFGKMIGLYKCKCGNEKEISNAYVKSGHTKSCGCLQGIQSPEKYIGHKFSYLTCIEYLGKGLDGTHLAKFKCDCGIEKEYKLFAVLKGQCKSCGCFKNTQLGKKATTHGLSKHPLYSIFGGIIDRCENENNPRYSDYGGRGIKMCEEWRNDFKCFYDWAMANGWRKGLQIDKDIKARKMGIEGLIYSPEMCSVVTHKENGNSTRTNKYLTHNNITLTISQWADKLNISSLLIYKRLKRGWDVDKALLTPKIEIFMKKRISIKYSFGYIN